MQRTTIALLLAGSLLAAGLLTAAATDLTPANPLSNPSNASSSSLAASVPGECTATTSEPAFPQDATVESFTGDAAGASSMRLDLTAWHGGILLTTWEQDTWKVEVAQVEEQDRLQPRVSGAVDGGVLRLTAHVVDDQQVSYESWGASVSANGQPQAHLKVWVPNLPADQVKLQDEPSRSGLHVNVGEVEPDDVTPPWNDTDDADEFPVLVNGLDGSKLHVDVDNIDTVLNQARFTDVHVAGDNGDVAALGVDASTAELDTDNGNVCLHGGSADEVRVTTDNGDVALADLQVTHLSAHTDSGNVAGSILPVASGSIQAETDNGNVVLEVPTGSPYGYDAQAQTDNGEIKVNLPGTTTTSDGDDHGPKSVHARTDGFGDRDIRVTVNLLTDNGSIVLGST